MTLSQANIDALFDPEPEAADAAPSAAPEVLGPRCGKLANILTLLIPITVVLATRKLPIETILKTRVGTILEFDVVFDTDLVLEVAGQGIAQGQAVKVGENFGIRLTKVGPVKDLIHAMGGG